MNEYSFMRRKMIEEQLIQRGIKDVRVLDAMNKVKRENFIPGEQKINAYYDGPLPIGRGQTISQPYMVAKMTEELKLEREEKVLEIGTGSGYQAAILSLLSKEVITVERDKELAKKAKENLSEFKNVTIITQDGTKGYVEKSPYDGILVTAGAPFVPQALVEQLNDGGRLVIPVGDRYSQVLTKIIKRGEDIEEIEGILCVFVPLRGEEGWPE